MAKIGLFIFSKKEATYKTEFYNSSYNQNTEQYFELIIFNYLKLING